MRKIFGLIVALILNFNINAQICPLDEAVDFTATDCFGNKINLFDILDGGQAVFIHFFLTYNFDPLIMPYMTEAYTIMGCNSHDVFFMEIAHREDNLECLQWIDRFNVEYPTISIEGGGQEITDLYDIQACPTLILIMPDRSITIHGAYELYPTSTNDIVNALAQYGNLQPNECDSQITLENDEDVFTVYPNPAKDFIIINGDNLETITIYNALGQKMDEFDNFENQLRISIAHYPDGIYHVVGVARLERATACTPCKNASQLHHTPILECKDRDFFVCKTKKSLSLQKISTY